MNKAGQMTPQFLKEKKNQPHYYYRTMNGFGNLAFAETLMFLGELKISKILLICETYCR